MPRGTVMLIFSSFCMMLKSSWCLDKHRLLRDDFTPKVHQRRLPPPLYHTEHLHSDLLLHFILVHLLLLAHFLLSSQYFRTTWTICKMKDSESGPRSKGGEAGRKQSWGIRRALRSPRSRGWAQLMTCCCMMKLGLDHYFYPSTTAVSATTFSAAWQLVTKMHPPLLALD